VPRRPSTHIDDVAATGRRIKELRDAAGLTQRQLAFEGCTPAYLSRVESGQRIPSLQILRELARRLGTTAEYLASGVAASEDRDPLFDAELSARTGDRKRAQQLYETARASHSAMTAARAAVGLGRLAYDDGEHEQAAEYLEEAVASEALPPPDRNAAFDLLGRTLALLARFDESRAVFDSALRAAREASDSAAELRFSVLLANLLIDRGSLDAAEELLASILATARAATDPVELSNLYWSQARLHASQGRQDLAARYARMAHAALESTEHTVFAARALMLLAHIENDRRNYAEALALADEGTPVLAAAGNRLDEGMLLLEKARGLAGLGQRQDAIGIVLGAIPRFEHAHPKSAARGYSIAAGLFRDLAEPGRALELYELAAETAPTEDRHLSEIYRAIAEIHESEERSDDALSYFKRALDVQDRVRHG
jgi:transcriptional regulator with XRE-family HTH domain